MKTLNVSARVITAVALVVNAYIHFVLAVPFDALRGTLLSLGDLFRIQGSVNVVIAILIVVFSRRWIALAAAAIAGLGIAMLVISVYAPLDLTPIGLPLISESVWYPDKLISLAAQGVAMVTALLVALSGTPRRAVEAQT